MGDLFDEFMRELERRFPAGLKYAIVYDTTPFVRESVDEVKKTLLDAIRDGEIVQSRLSDDIADVAADLYHGLAHFKAGRADEALWWWQYSYLANWGSTASSALRALHSAVAHTRLAPSADA